MKSIRRVAGYGPWAVAAALCLDVAYPLQAAPPAASQAVSFKPVAVPAEDAEAAINVQVAWLAEPGLFLCTLSTRTTAKGVELHGFVSNEPAHQKALAIARALYTGPVIDQIKRHYGIPIQMSHGAAPNELANAASSLLAEALGDKVLGLRVVCPSAGRVEVTGKLSSLDDKLLVSKCMKSLSGCTHVVNKTSAPGSTEGAAIVANIPMMMTKPGNDGSVNWKSVNNFSGGSSQPVMITRSMPTTSMPMIVRNEAPAPRMIVTPQSKRSSETRMAVIPPPVDMKPGYAQISDIKSAATTKDEFVQTPQPTWPAMPAAPIEVTRAAGAADSNSTGSKPQVLNFMPVAPDIEPASQAPKTIAKAIVDVPEPPRPIIVPPIMPAAPQVVAEPMAPPGKGTAMVQSPYAGQAKAITGSAIQPITAELPKPADLSKPIDLPQPIVEIPATGPGKACVTDLAKIETPKVVEAAKCEPTPAADAPKCDKTCECATATCQDGPKMEPAMPVAPRVDMPIPAAVELAKVVSSKVERGAAQKVAPTTPVKTVTYTPEVVAPSQSGKEPISITLDAETARRAVEDICRGAGSDLKVTAGPGHQLTVGMKIANQGDWDRLYTKIKALPEISGYTIVCQTQVESAGVKASPAIAVLDASSKSSSTPMMGVLRSPSTSATPSADAAKSAIETLCRGKGEDVIVRTPGGKQVAVSMKVATATDWDVVYAQIKTLPEIAGCSVIYNVSVK